MAFSENEIDPLTSTELKDLYSPYNVIEKRAETSSKSKIRFVDAIANGLRQSMRKYENSVIMGQDIAEYGGVFKITDGFVKSSERTSSKYSYL